MIQTVYTQFSKTKLKLIDKALSQDNSGAYYQIISPESYVNCEVKLYNIHFRNNQTASKLEFLLKHPLEDNERTINWVKDCIVDEGGHLLGYCIEKKAGEQLALLVSPQLPAAFKSQPFRRGTNESLYARLKICLDITVFIKKLHQTGYYSLGNYNLNHILIKADNTVTFHHPDNLKITDTALNEHQIGLNQMDVQSDVSVHHAYYMAEDYYKMAVFFLKILTGVSPIISLKNSSVHPLPDASTDFIAKHKQLPPSIKDLLMQCFDDKNSATKKLPSAYQWYQTLTQSLAIDVDSPQSKQLQYRMQYFSHFTNPKNPIYFNNNLRELLAKKEVSEQAEQNHNKTIPQAKNTIYLLLIAVFILLYVLLSNSLSVALFTFVLVVLTFYALTFSQYLRWKTSLKTNAFSNDYRQAHLIKENENSTYVLQEKFETLTSLYKKILERPFQKSLKKYRVDIDQIMQRLEQEVDLFERQYSGYVASEQYEYEALHQKYLRMLRTLAAYSEASSLDNAYHDTLPEFDISTDMQFKYTNLTNTNEQQSLTNYRRQVFNIQQAIKQEKRRIKLAEKQEYSRIKRQLKRQEAQKSKVADNLKHQVNMQPEAIKALLNKYEIDDLHDINGFDQHGNIIALDGQVLPIQPLKKYQIADLINWWNICKNEQPIIPDNLKDIIHEKYNNAWSVYEQKQKDKIDILIKKIYALEKEMLIKRAHEGNISSLESNNYSRGKTAHQLYQWMIERDKEIESISLNYESLKSALVQTLIKDMDRAEKQIKTMLNWEAYDDELIEKYLELRVRYQDFLEQNKKDIILHHQYTQVLSSDKYNSNSVLSFGEFLKAMFFNEQKLAK